MVICIVHGSLLDTKQRPTNPSDQARMMRRACSQAVEETPLSDEEEAKVPASYTQQCIRDIMIRSTDSVIV